MIDWMISGQDQPVLCILLPCTERRKCIPANVPVNLIRLWHRSRTPPPTPLPPRPPNPTLIIRPRPPVLCILLPRTECRECLTIDVAIILIRLRRHQPVCHEQAHHAFVPDTRQYQLNPHLAQYDLGGGRGGGGGGGGGSEGFTCIISSSTPLWRSTVFGGGMGREGRGA